MIKRSVSGKPPACYTGVSQYQPCVVVVLFINPKMFHMKHIEENMKHKGIAPGVAIGKVKRFTIIFPDTQGIVSIRWAWLKDVLVYTKPYRVLTARRKFAGVNSRAGVLRG